MDYLSGLISSRFNCTVPWLLYHVRFRNLDIPVCGSNVSALANQLYLKNQFPALDTCASACTTMGVTGMLTSKEECSTCTNKAVTLVFGKSIFVSREVLAYPLLSLLAEVGGYLGLTLGVSLSDLRTAVIRVVGLSKVARKERATL